ncbi:hypothetical protein MTO96_034169 [Rhipicephalus appendiculatus]
MTQRDIGKVCTLLDRMAAEAVRALTQVGTSWLPNVKSASKREAIEYIRNALEAIGNTDQRLMAIAWLYCCLTEREALHTWWSYRLSLNYTEGPYQFCLHERLSSLVANAGERTLYEKIERQHAVYACMITAYATPSLVEHNVLCMCFPRTLPYVFVHFAGNKQRFTFFIRQVFVEPLCKGGVRPTWRPKLRTPQSRK